MALTDVPQLKAYLKVENTVEDALLSDLRASAIALIETLIGRPILDPPGSRTFGALRRRYPTLRGLRVSDAAPNTRQTFIGTDALGRVTGVAPSTSIPGLPALSLNPDYAWRWEPLINQAIRDAVSEFYNHRSSLVIQESSGGGVNTTFDRRADGLPPRVRMALRPIVDLGG